MSWVYRCLHVPPVTDRSTKGEELKLEDQEENANKQGEELTKREHNCEEIEEGTRKPASEPTVCPEDIELVKTAEK